MVLALLYLLLAYWELIARGSMSASWWAFVPMMLAIGLLLRKSIFLYLLRVFVWFQAMMLVSLCNDGPVTILLDSHKNF